MVRIFPQQRTTEAEASEVASRRTDRAAKASNRRIMAAGTCKPDAARRQRRSRAENHGDARAA
jgi:hypothetical protein